MAQNVTAGTGPNPQLTFDNNNHLSGSPYVTDAAGNVTYDGFHSYTYDAEGRIAEVDSNTATYVYDSSGRRVEAAGSGWKYDFVYDLAGRLLSSVNGQNAWNATEIYAGGRHLATYFGGTTTFNHTDWLGTERARSNTSGALVETCVSLPFGDGFSCSGPDTSPLHFTGQYHDAESNLDHFWFRQYASAEGRWLMPDPAGFSAANPANPQTWNRYGYIVNDPTNQTDPLGSYPPACTDDECFAVCLGMFAYMTPTGPVESCGSFTWFLPMLWPLPRGGRRSPVENPGTSSGSGGKHIGGPSLNGETLGIPSGMRMNPGNIWSVLLPIDPGCEFGPCVPIANNFGAGEVAAAGATLEGICLIAEPCGVGEAIFGGIFIGTVAAIDAFRYFAKGGPQNIPPSWVTDRPLPGESADEFARRVCTARYGNVAGCDRDCSSSGPSCHNLCGAVGKTKR